MNIARPSVLRSFTPRVSQLLQGARPYGGIFRIAPALGVSFGAFPSLANGLVIETTNLTDSVFGGDARQIRIVLHNRTGRTTGADLHCRVYQIADEIAVPLYERPLKTLTL